MIHNWDATTKFVTEESTTKAISRGEFLIDTADDVADLPGTDTMLPGSIAYCIAGKKMYILNSAGTWVEQ